MTGNGLTKAGSLRCSICADTEWYNPINGWLARGLPYRAIQRLLKQQNAARVYTAPTLKRHHEHLLLVRKAERKFSQPIAASARASGGFALDPDDEPRPASARSIEIDRPEGATDEDLAELIVRAAAQGVREGALGVTVKDGLAAQTILDRRAERAEGNTLIIALGKLLAGAGHGPVRVIEGEAHEVPALPAPQEDLVELVAKTTLTIADEDEPEASDDDDN